jgi:hypothetical protein
MNWTQWIRTTGHPNNRTSLCSIPHAGLREVEGIGTWRTFRQESNCFIELSVVRKRGMVVIIYVKGAVVYWNYWEYEECRLLRYKTPVRTSQETHYFSTTESSRLMLCKIWGFHGGDYEECRLLRYKNPVRTSQETHYVSATESSQLMLCKIWGSHGGDYEGCRLLGCYAVWLDSVVET